MITIIDYGAGNIVSVKRALDHMGIENKISNDPREIKEAERLIFPGVGHAGAAMENLRSTGIGEALVYACSERKIPVLGICLGAQILLDFSQEADTKCLGLIEGEVRRFLLTDSNLKVPHMGWNSVDITRPHFLLKNVQSGSEFYFVHSFYLNPAHDEVVIGRCSYGIDFPVIIGKDNLVATQFHPEKSGLLGLEILKAFSLWRP